MCPVRASIPDGDPYRVTDNFRNHLTAEHRSEPRDLKSFLDKPTSSRHDLRRISHSSGGMGGHRIRCLESCSSPMTVILLQLSGMRHVGVDTGQATQLQRLRMQLQLELQKVKAAMRHQLGWLSRRQPPAIGYISGSNSVTRSPGGNGAGSSAVGSISRSGSAEGSGSIFDTAGDAGSHHHSTMIGVVSNNSSNDSTSTVNDSSGSSAKNLFLLLRQLTKLESGSTCVLPPKISLSEI